MNLFNKQLRAFSHTMISSSYVNYGRNWRNIDYGKLESSFKSFQ